MKQAQEHAASILNGIAYEAKAAGVNCETMQVIQHDPEMAIVNTAKERGCDLIVIASHGRSGIAAALLGSVTAKVLTRTVHSGTGLSLTRSALRSRDTGPLSRRQFFD